MTAQQARNPEIRYLRHAFPWPLLCVSDRESLAWMPAAANNSVDASTLARTNFAIALPRKVVAIPRRVYRGDRACHPRAYIA